MTNKAGDELGKCLSSISYGDKIFLNVASIRVKQMSNFVFSIIVTSQLLPSEWISLWDFQCMKKPSDDKESQSIPFLSSLSCIFHWIKSLVKIRKCQKLGRLESMMLIKWVLAMGDFVVISLE